MLQYISYWQLCSNVLQNKLSRRQQKDIVNVFFPKVTEEKFSFWEKKYRFFGL